MAKLDRRIRWAMEFAALYGLYGGSRLLPLRWMGAWGRNLGRFVYRFLPIRRRVVLDNLTASFGAEMSPGEIRALARLFYANLGVTLLEFFALPRLGREKIRQMVSVKGFEHLDACRRAGHGGLLVSGHYGNWELAGSIIAAHDYPIRYVIKSQSNPYVDRIQNQIRTHAGIGTIRQGSAVREIVYALRRKEFVGLLADQDGGNDGIFVEFLGRTASVFKGPAYFAYRTGCPLLPTAIVRRPDGGHDMTIGPPITVDPTWDEETAVLELTRRHTAALSGLIRRAPENYFWVHRRWKTQPRAQDNAAEPLP